MITNSSSWVQGYNLLEAMFEEERTLVRLSEKNTNYHPPATEEERS